MYYNDDNAYEYKQKRSSRTSSTASGSASPRRPARGCAWSRPAAAPGQSKRTY